MWPDDDPGPLRGDIPDEWPRRARENMHAIDLYDARREDGEDEEER